jgi:hypothetical protein
MNSSPAASKYNVCDVTAFRGFRRADCKVYSHLGIMHMKKITTLGVTIGATLCLGLLAQADEIQFTTLPQPVQTTVIRETHITSPSSVTRVIRQDSGVYAVTVHRDTGDQVIYVNDTGNMVQEPATTQTVVTQEQVQQDLPRYQLLEKKGKKEVYFDRQTGQKVTVKREND